MEQTLGQDSSPASGPIDKSKVLNVKPLRRLAPVFPSANNVSSSLNAQGGAPFVCASPSGPFPPGISPFYPFFFSTESQNQQTPGSAPLGFNGPISNAVPISSFRTPVSANAGAANGDTGSSKRAARTHSQPPAHNGEDGYNDVHSQNAQHLNSFSIHIVDGEEMNRAGRPRRKSLKRTRGDQNISPASPEVDLDSLLNDMLTSLNVSMFDTARRSDGDKDTVGYVLVVCDLLRRRISQVEEAKETTPGVVRRPDLKAAAALMSKGVRTNANRRIGAVPGVEVGDIFFFRMELCLVGLHAPSMAGIDYLSLKNSNEDEPVAVSIVSSGGYEDDNDDPDVLIYTGHGGNLNRKDKELMDQKLERGNLALEKSLHRGNEVRVIRGIKDVANPTGKVYVYDGLYKIQESWVEKGKSGCNVFKYKLVRLPCQTNSFLTWKLVQQWKDGAASRIGVILSDLTSGAENLPVSLVNDVDDEKGPAYFTYVPGLKCSKAMNSVEPPNGCSCVGGCLPGNTNCPCIRKNGGYLPYSANGVLLSTKSLIYECGPLCNCPPNCRNRLSQGGLKIRLEVFRTKNRGWGLRSWDPIRAGSYICEYAGEVIDSMKEKEFTGDGEDEYIFDTTRTYQPLDIMPVDPTEPSRIPFPFIITSKNAGNVARFMNHSCTPNVYWRPVLRENKNEYDCHIAFHAVRHLPPMTELTYDYGAVPPEKTDARKKKCFCGSVKCRGYFY